MAQLRTPLLQPYLNPWTASITPFSISSQCSRDQPNQMKKTPPRKQVSPRNGKCRNYSYLIKKSEYNNSIMRYLNRTRISLIDIPSSKNDFDVQNGVVHALQLRPLEEENFEIEEINTSASVYIEQEETTSLNSFNCSVNSEIVTRSYDKNTQNTHFFQ